MPQFLPTVWPGGLIKPPAVARPADVLVLEDGWLQLIEPFEEVELPSGFYLREMSQDRPRDTASAGGFVRTWGRAADPLHRDLVAGTQWLQGLGEDENGRPEKDALAASREVAEKRLGRGRGRGDDLVHASEVIMRGRLIETLVEHVMRCRDQEGASVLSWDVFMEVVNAALSAFQVRVFVEGEDRPFALPHETAYSVAALQLYNDLATGTTIRACANETCSRVFSVQRGQAAHYQRTSGTKYCTNACARAQAERERRRRQKRTS